MATPFPFFVHRNHPPSPPSSFARSSAVARPPASVLPSVLLIAWISCATAARMKNSPSPVQETAHVSLLAYVPAPITGESPIRPGRLLSCHPWGSPRPGCHSRPGSATRPMSILLRDKDSPPAPPCFSASLILCKESSAVHKKVFFIDHFDPVFFRERFRAVADHHNGTNARLLRFNVFQISISMRARLIGFFTCFTFATAPAFAFCHP